ncbi:MAG TPA: DEAD/DEAH box helicase [Longimicrobium sp.]
MASFNDLGLREPLLAALEEAGFERPTALQQAAIPILRREGNLVARAASGAGKTLAYGLGVLDRIEARADDEAEEGSETETGTRVLVLAATPEHALRATLELVPLAQAVGLTVTASGRGWGTAAGEADILVATPAEVLEAVRTSGVKLETLEAIVVDGASEIEAMGGWEAAETLFDHAPRGAQRVLFTADLTPGVEDMVDRRIKRALRYPPTPAVPDAEPAQATGVFGYVIVSEREKLETVARLLGGDRDGDAAPVLVCRSEERAAQVAEALALRGFMAGDADDEDVDVSVISSGAGPEELREQLGGTVISFDVPPDEATLRALHGGEMTGFVLLLPRELAHLRQIAQLALLDPRPAGITGEEPAGRDEVRAFRDSIRRAVREEDLSAQMLVLEPLFEDFTPAEVAAAVAALLRRKPPVQAPEAAPAAPRARPAAAPAPERSTAGGATAAYARLFVSIGERDGVRPGDLVGTIAGETDIPGSQIGKVDIRDTFSIVEVPADIAERVIAALNGTTIKGRSVRADFDRGNARKPGGPGGPRGPRREDRGPRGDGGFRRPPSRRPRDD